MDWILHRRRNRLPAAPEVSIALAAGRMIAVSVFGLVTAGPAAVAIVVSALMAAVFVVNVVLEANVVLEVNVVLANAAFEVNAVLEVNGPVTAAPVYVRMVAVFVVVAVVVDLGTAG